MMLRRWPPSLPQLSSELVAAGTAAPLPHFQDVLAIASPAGAGSVLVDDPASACIALLVCCLLILATALLRLKALPMTGALVERPWNLARMLRTSVDSADAPAPCLLQLSISRT
ncbi:MAG: hypothetical protein ACKVI4_10390 [Actinomycetales bacterium]